MPQIEKLTSAVAERMKKGGRLFYIGAGTSGRLGVVDASECPPTYGVPFDWVVGIIAGGDTAIRKAVEFAEDDAAQAWKDLEEFNINDYHVKILKMQNKSVDLIELTYEEPNIDNDLTNEMGEI